MKITGIIFSVLFLILFVFSVFIKLNLTYFFVSTFLFFSCFGNDFNVYFERTSVQNLNKKISEPVEIKSVVFNADTPIYKLLKHINSSHYTMFYLMENNKIKKILTEVDVLKLIEKNN
jgi:hypothetical protein